MAGYQNNKLESFEYWSLLPPEVQNHVLSFLRDYEKQRLVDVFPNIVNIIKRIDIIEPQKEYLDLLVKCPKVTSIIVYESPDIVGFMVKIARVNQNLKSINLAVTYDCETDVHSPIRRHYIEAVKELDPGYDGTKFEGRLSFGDIAELVSKYPSIQLKGYLQLDHRYGHNGVEFFLTKKLAMDMIEYLYIPDVDDVQEHLFLALSLMLPKLRFLEVGGVENGELIKLLPLLRLPTIESVDLYNCHDKDLLKFTFPNIKTFSLSSSSTHDDHPYLTVDGNQCILDVGSNPLKLVDELAGIRCTGLIELLTKVFPQVQAVILNVAVQQLTDQLRIVGRNIPITAGIVHEPPDRWRSGPVT